MNSPGCSRLKKADAEWWLRCLALLELLKQALVDLVQAETFGPIHVKATGAADVDLSRIVIEGEDA